MSLRTILAALLVIEVTAFVGVALLYFGGLRRLLIERRVARLLATDPLPARDRIAAQDLDSPLVRLFLRDIPEEHLKAIVWLGGRYGLSAARSLQTFAVGRLALIGLGFATAFVLVDIVLANFNAGLLLKVVAGLAGAYLNWWAGSRYIRGVSRARQDTVAMGMPYALDLVLICLDSGIALEAAIARVSTELETRDPLVAQELSRTLLDINILGNREQAFRNLGERIDTDSMRAIVAVLCQSLQYGSSLVDSLKDAIENMKRVELLTLEERAGKLPVQLTLPGLVFTLPQVIILLAGPGVLSLLDVLGGG